MKTEQLSQRAINWDTEATGSCGLGGGPCATSTGSEPQPAPCPAVTGENQADSCSGSVRSWQTHGGWLPFPGWGVGDCKGCWLRPRGTAGHNWVLRVGRTVQFDSYTKHLNPRRLLTKRHWYCPPMNSDPKHKLPELSRDHIRLNPPISPSFSGLAPRGTSLTTDKRWWDRRVSNSP